MAQKGLMIAGLASASGKTIVTLGLLRACKRQEQSQNRPPIAAAKAGPDYIDTGFHTAALGSASVNLDAFAMKPNLLCNLANQQQGDILIIEGVMGLHDGGQASSAHVAQALGVPIVLVMDISGQAETAASIADGVRTSLKAMDVELAGVILNRSKSTRHKELASNALQAQGIRVLGAIPDTPSLHVPSRHLGLIQAPDLMDIEATLNHAADTIEAAIDIDSLLETASTLTRCDDQEAEAMPPPSSKIALAQDGAFGFGYEHLIRGWRRQGAQVIPFSPLADEAPHRDAGFIFLPGGYPELHLEQLARASRFQQAIRTHAAAGTAIYGECGGYMVLGEAIIDRQGESIPMLGLLKLETSFAKPALTLGYRRLDLVGTAPLPRKALGHEFHYTAAIREEGAPLFEAADKNNAPLGRTGLSAGSVAGSYMHIIAAA